jgi:CubicO group peptidase (beta-lactamase class C family)
MQAAEFDSIIQEHMARYRVPGLSVAIAHRGLLEHAAGYGFADLEHRVGATTDTVYQTASVGKQFTSALILLLTERGLLSVDDSVAQYFNSPPAAWSNITVRHLLTHTSGISDEGFGRLNLRLDYTDDELLSTIASTQLQSAPGAVCSYSNSGYILLGVLVARLTGRFYGDLLRELIFTPLEMATARVISEEDIVPNRASGYRLDGDRLLNQEYVSPSLNRTADGGLYVTVLDLAKWDRALHAGTLLSAASMDAMWTPVTLTGGSTEPYGFGWSLASTPHGRMVEHAGEWQGFSSHIVRYLDAGVSVMVLANSADAPVSDLAAQIGALIFPDIDQMDFTGSFEVLARLPGASVHLLWKELTPVRDGFGLILTPTSTLNAAPPIDVLLVPGGRGQLPLMDDEVVLAWLRSRAAEARYILSVCTGALTLGAAGLLRGRRVTTHWNSFHLLSCFGAVPENARVVVDGNLISSAGVSAGIDASLRLAAMMEGEGIAQQIQLEIQYAPEPPFAAGSPALAPPTVLESTRQRVASVTAARCEAAKRAANRLGIGLTNS